MSYGIIVVVFGVVWYVARKIFTGQNMSNENETEVNESLINNNTHGRERSMSFGSRAMAKGVFPAETNAKSTIINGVLYFKKCPTAESLVEKCKTLLYYDRFRSSLSKSKTSFVDISKNINIENDLIQTVQVDSEDHLKSKIDEFCNEDMTYNDLKPLWIFIRLVNKNNAEKSAILLRLHHAMGDGISMISLMTEIFCDKVTEKMGGGMTSTFSLSTIWKFITSTLQVISLPMTKYDSNIKFNSNERTTLKWGKSRATIFFPTLRLDFVKEIKNKANVTVNDVMLSLTSGAIRRYCKIKQDPLIVTTMKENLLCRTLMPVAFPRKISEKTPEKALRNYFAMVSVPIPIGASDCQDRLFECALSTRKLKSTPTALLQLLIQNNVLALAPEFLQKKTALDVFTRHSLVFSNLPGPKSEITMCGEDLLAIYCVFPNLIPQVIMISYNGGIFFCMNVDPDLIDIKEMPRLFMEEVVELATSFGIDTSEANMILPNSA